MAFKVILYSVIAVIPPLPYEVETEWVKQNLPKELRKTLKKIK